jgi:carbon storage regulator
MLILSRRRDEVIVVILEDGTEIKFKVVDIRPDNVRIGIDAPKNVAIHRLEIWDAIKKKNPPETD